MSLLIKFFLAFVVVSSVQGKDSEQCVHHDSCGSCLAAAQHCSWCTDRNFDMRLTRCMTKHDLIKFKCSEEKILMNKVTKIENVENNATRDYSREGGGQRLNAVQIRPQNVKFKLQKGRTESIRMVYRPAKNYPFDLYYLMDLTYSMRDDKETLLGVGNKLASSLNSLSENYRIGFGSFGDKNTLPFIIPGLEANPCAPEQATCKPLYSYRHSLSLTEDVSEFIRRVNSSEITGNLDTTEGGMDALMQLLVCKEQIGWNNQSRKIVVFASDAKQHFAGDGRMAGITEVNDKKCHLDASGEYTESLVYDYPSLEQIYRELVKNKVNIIFAVTKDLINHYNQLNDVMDEISAVGQLDSDSSNILQLVEAGYKEFVRRATFTDNSADYIKMTYRTTCGGKYEEFVETSKCDNIELGKDYEFNIDVQLLDNPEDHDNVFNHKIRIEESSIDGEALVMDITIDHGCSCMDEEVGETNSTICNHHGEMKCGMCLCDEGWAGKTCECNLQSYSSSKKLETECREPYVENGETKYTPVCSNNGECLCGTCYCNVGFLGKFCNCLECPFLNGMPCGGADHGDCTCSGKCKCQPGWKGENCDCSTSVKGCSAPNSEKVCSGRGSCQCERCDCEAGFVGTFCESTIGGENGLCTFYEPCVQCIVSRKLGDECSNFDEVCKSEYGDTYGHSFVANLDENRIKCLALVKYQDSTLQYKFVYDINKDHDTLLTIEDQDPVFAKRAGLFSLLGIILATLLVGLISICCYVCCLRAKDRREVAAFEQRLADTKYEFDSPIYKSPITEFRVPQRREDGGFEMISNPTPKSPATESGNFVFNNGKASPQSPGVVFRPPFKQSESVDSKSIVYQTSSVLARDITNSASPTENTSSIIFNRFPVEPPHLSSTVTQVSRKPITPKPSPRTVTQVIEAESSPQPAVYKKFDDNHQIIRTTTINQRPISPIASYSPSPDDRYFRTPSAPARPLSPTSSLTSTSITRYFVNGQEVDQPIDDSSSSVSATTRTFNRHVLGDELPQQRTTTVRRYFVNGQEVDQPFDDNSSSASTTRTFNRPLPGDDMSPQRTTTVRRYFVNGQEVDQPFDDNSSLVSTTRTFNRSLPGDDRNTTVRRYLVNGQEVENPYMYDDDFNSSVSTTTKTVYRTISSEEPAVTPVRFQYVDDQPQTVVSKMYSTPTQQRAEYFDAGGQTEGQIVQTETIIRRTIMEPGQSSPISEKFITIRTSESQASPTRQEFNSFGK